MKREDDIVALAKRVDHIEKWQLEVDDWRSNINAIVDELRELNHTVREIAAAVRIFTKIGNAIKWLSAVGAATAVAVAAMKEFLR